MPWNIIANKGTLYHCDQFLLDSFQFACPDDLVKAISIQIFEIWEDCEAQLHEKNTPTGSSAILSPHDLPSPIASSTE